MEVKDIDFELIFGRALKRACLVIEVYTNGSSKSKDVYDSLIKEVLEDLKEEGILGKALGCVLTCDKLYDSWIE